jgi:protein BCP1
MLAQLFQADAELLHTQELAELIISQPLLGTTVKTDGIESDPYAFLTVLNLRQHRVTPKIYSGYWITIRSIILGPRCYQSPH